MDVDLSQQLSEISISPPKLIVDQVPLPTLEEVVEHANIPLDKDVLKFRVDKKLFLLRLVRDHGKIFFVYIPSQISSETPEGIIRKVIALVNPDASTQGRSWQSIFFLGMSLRSYRSSAYLDKIMSKLMELSKDIIDVQFTGDLRGRGNAAFILIVKDPESFKSTHKHIVADRSIMVRQDRSPKLVPQGLVYHESSIVRGL